MSNLGEDLRRRTAASVLALTERERIELAFALGEDDLARYMSATGLDRAQALRRLRAGRQRGRTPCACTSDARP